MGDWKRGCKATHRRKTHGARRDRQRHIATGRATSTVTTRAHLRQSEPGTARSHKRNGCMDRSHCRHRRMDRSARQPRGRCHLRGRRRSRHRRLRLAGRIMARRRGLMIRWEQRKPVMRARLRIRARERLDVGRPSIPALKSKSPVAAVAVRHLDSLVTRRSGESARGARERLHAHVSRQ